MTDEEAKAAAHRLHKNIFASFNDSDMKKVASFLQEIFAQGQRAPRLGPGPIVEIPLPGGRAWLAT